MTDEVQKLDDDIAALRQEIMDSIAKMKADIDMLEKAILSLIDLGGMDPLEIDSDD